jgi:hypothetical protein
MGSGTEQRLVRLEARLASLEADNQALQRVKDAQEIQNVFSLHEYYHMAGRHGDEMDAIWAQKTPGLAMEEAVLKGRYVGLEFVRAYYVDFFDRCLFGGMRQAMRELYPDADPGPDTGAPFGVRLLHTLTTPVIEVAEDRGTAKAVWLSPGFPRPNAPSMISYDGYSPFTRASWVPEPPVPYRTFSETFSY